MCVLVAKESVSFLCDNERLTLQTIQLLHLHFARRDVKGLSVILRELSSSYEVGKVIKANEILSLDGRDNI